MSDDTPHEDGEVPHPDNYTGDLASIHPTGYAALRIDSPLIHNETMVSAEDEIENFGIEVLQDGTFMGLSAGSFEEPDELWNVHTFHSLTPEQAREIADSLNEVADTVEAFQREKEQENEDPDSFLRRLLG